jgi:hypothetical protein
MGSVKYNIMNLWNFVIFFLLVIGVFIFTVNGETVEKVNCSSPDYSVSGIVLPVSEGIISPGSSLHPVLTLKNEGASDPGNRDVEIKGYLNDTLLKGVSARIIAPGAGEEMVYTLVYQLPDTIEYGNYRLFLVVEPGIMVKETNTSNNRGKAGGMVSITPPDDNSFIGCEACWEKYK